MGVTFCLGAFEGMAMMCSLLDVYNSETQTA
jgi:hypothetical protein